MNDINKKAIISQYLIDKIIAKLDETQIWQENLADTAEKNEPALEGQWKLDKCMRALAHDLRGIMDLVQELDELTNDKETKDVLLHDCSRDGVDCRCWEE